MSRSSVAAIVCVFAVSAAWAAGPWRVGEERELRFEAPRPSPSAGRGEVAWRQVIRRPGASYVAVHFERFELAPGEKVIVASGDGDVVASIDERGRPGANGGFWAPHVPGDTCVVTYIAGGAPAGGGFAIDRVAQGFPGEPRFDSTEAICGADDSAWAPCYSAAEPRVYEESRAVLRLIINGTSACTGWLVGCDGHVLTNQHCIGTQADASNTDFEIMAEGANCATSCAAFGACPGTILAGTATLVATDAGADASLLLLAPNPASTYGYMKMRASGARVGERIYIPGHPLGWGKRIALASSAPSDGSGFCEVDSVDRPPCYSGGPQDVGYDCDTQEASSGSPVVAYSDHGVVALHHCANCPNRGVPIQSVISAVGSPLPPCALLQLAGTVTFDRGSYGCSDTVGITVVDDSITGAGTQEVTIVSSTEATPESVTLVETPAVSGTFQGTIVTTTAPPVAANGVLSVVPGGSITVHYVDADDGAGGTGLAREDTAVVDCQPPLITGVQATGVTGNSAVITWTTGEPATSLVRYGIATPPVETATVPGLATSHSVPLTGLAECTLYRYGVESADEAGNLSSDSAGGAYYSFTTGRNVHPTYPSSGPAVAIPDDDPVGVSSGIAVADDKQVLDVDVTVDIRHTYDGDLRLELVPPVGPVIPLADMRGGSGDDYVATTFDDEAGTAIGAGAPPFTGTFRPESPLSALDGITASGTWTLRVVDGAPGDVGTIEGWSLTPTFANSVCGPHATYVSHALAQDSCATGGAGHLDGGWDAGEQIQLSLTIRNDGSVPLTGVTGSLTPSSDGVKMVDPVTSFPNLAVGASAASIAPHVTMRSSASLPCGTTMSFTLDVASAQGGSASTFSQLLGEATPGGGTALDEGFASGIPLSWTIVDGGTGGGASATWTTANPGARSLTPPLSSPAPAVDSAAAGAAATQDEQLVTPAMDLGYATSVTLQFDQYFRWYAGGLDEMGDVDVRSVNTGEAWVNVFRNRGASSPNPNHRTLDISPQAAGAYDARVRFRYWNASFEWYWQLDNVLVTYGSPPGCLMEACWPPSIPSPPAVPDGIVGTPMKASRLNASGSSVRVTWDKNTCGGTSFHLVAGPLGQLPSYAVTAAACGLGTSGTYDWTSVPAGSLWFVVVADDGVETEGSWGSDGTGAPIKEATPSYVCGIFYRNNDALCP